VKKKVSNVTSKCAVMEMICVTFLTAKGLLWIFAIFI